MHFICYNDRKANMSKRYLIIGAIPTNNPTSIGGVTVLVQQILDYFNENKIDYIYIRTNKYFTNEDKLAFIKNYIYVIYFFLKYVRSIDIVFINVATNGMYYLSPVLLFLSKIFRTRVVTRIFGGHSIDLYENTIILKKYLLKYVFVHSDVLFFETKYLVEYFKNLNINTFWFPNVRQKTNNLREGNFKKRFVFVSRIKKIKGIVELLQASNLLDKSFTVDIYGPINEDMKNIDFCDYKAEYKGNLNPNEVLDVLRLYDVLVLPTFWRGEGYPGVILEALSIGMPVITTDLKSISEMINNSCGILVDVKNSKSLAIAMKSINELNYQFFSKSALEKFSDFEYENVYRRIIFICEEINYLKDLKC